MLPLLFPFDKITEIGVEISRAAFMTEKVDMVNDLINENSEFIDNLK